VILTAIAGYVLGSISFARLITGWVCPEGDVTDLHVSIVGESERSKIEILGANAASMIVGAKYGAVVALLDML
jgi:glycerol-3-phosphate acyltransferase PlsY